MADHVVIQVRDALKAKVTGLATCGANVFLHSEQAQATLPCTLVEYSDEGDERQSIGLPAIEDLDVSFWLHILVKQTGDFEKAAFTIRKEIETALQSTVAGLTLDGKVQKLDRVGAQKGEDQLLDKPCYRLSLQYQIKIRHLESQPDSLVY
jgi:hypothetical protein